MEAPEDPRDLFWGGGSRSDAREGAGAGGVDRARDSTACRRRIPRQYCICTFVPVEQVNGTRIPRQYCICTFVVEKQVNGTRYLQAVVGHAKARDARHQSDLLRY